MPWFEYEGLTPGGTPLTGRIEGADADAARAELGRMQVSIRELRPAGSAPAGPARLSPDELIFFNQQLAGLAEAGLALDEGLAQLAQDVQSPRLRGWIAGVVEDLRRGMTIDQAFAAREAGLPVLYSQVVRAGVETGRLPVVLLNLNQHLQTAGTTRRLLWEAVSYPLVVGALALVVVSFFFTLVVPRFRSIFADFGTQLPGITVLALRIADNFLIILTVFAAAVVGLIALWHMLRWSPGGRQMRESLVLAVPLIGGIHRSSLIARFLRAVSVAVDTGMPLARAIRLSSDATGSTLLRVDAERLAGGLEHGLPIMQANQNARLIPPLFGYCVQAAGGRGDLSVAVGQLAQSYENRAVYGQSLIRALLLPVFILIIGNVLFFAILAMFLPLVHLINAVSSGS